MKKIKNVPLYFNKETGKLQQTEVPGSSFTVSAVEVVEVERRLVAYIDVSGSMAGVDLQKVVEQAKESGATAYNFFAMKLSYPKNIPIDGEVPDFKKIPGSGGSTNLDWITALPEEIIPLIFTDAEFTVRYWRAVLNNTGILISVIDDNFGK